MRATDSSEDELVNLNLYGNVYEMIQQSDKRLYLQYKVLVFSTCPYLYQRTYDRKQNTCIFINKIINKMSFQPKKRSNQRFQNNFHAEQEPVTFQTPQINAILKLKQKHEKNIQQAVKVIENLYFNKMPQKCFQHNNNFTLYCQNDQKPLCASCLYQNQSHKAHKVHALGNCLDLIKRDCDKMEKELEQINQNITGLMKHLNDGINKMDKQFPQIVWKIEDSYKKLHKFLDQRQKQHINELKYHKQRMKYQHGALSTQLNKIVLFIDEKVSHYSKKNDMQILLMKRNVLQCLKGSIKVVGEELNIKEQEPKLHFEVFSEVEQFIYCKLPFLFSKQSKYMQKNLKRGNSKQNLNHRAMDMSSFSPVSKQHGRYQQDVGKSKKKASKDTNNKSIEPELSRRRSGSKQDSKQKKLLFEFISKSKQKRNNSSPQNYRLKEKNGMRTPPKHSKNSLKSPIKTKQKLSKTPTKRQQRKNSRSGSKGKKEGSSFISAKQNSPARKRSNQKTPKQSRNRR